MHEHELELIAALAEGRLEDEAEARALVASDPRYQDEYEAQRTAFEALSALGSASLSETERSALHRDVWTELRSGSAAAPTRQPWYVRWVPVAAGMFVVVGIVAVINQSGSSDSSEEAAGFSAVTTTMADSTAGAPAADAAGDGEDSTVTEEDETAGSGGGDLGTADIARVLTPSGEQFYTEEAAEIRSGGADAEPLQEGSSDRLQDCVEESGLDGYSVLAAHPSPVAQTEGGAVPEDVTPYITAAPAGADLATDPIAFVDLFACKVLYVDGSLDD